MARTHEAVAALKGRYQGEPVRVLVIPGLHGSGPDHWQTWLQSRFRGALRVEQRDWSRPDLEAWADRVAQTLDRAPPGPWVAVAHSFGCLTLARHFLRQGSASPIKAALLVAPAEPRKFGVEALLPQGPLPIPTTLFASTNDPWMTLERAQHWAARWGSRSIDLGEVGHINVEAGFGPFPLAKRTVDALIRRVEQARRIDRVTAVELSYAI